MKDEEFPEGRMVAWMNGKPAIRDCDWPDENWILNRFERMPHDFLVEEPKGAKEYGWS
ncbi:hypothetical protein [Bifidobacterium pseudolongum]|uniref:hypothetical protein n=1 Tax=Bifidobacterium pseudolongum TaxID=1694 RepID=UPI00145571EC|nr:hypothetical protein [Bifidobacterium pseudolongum]